MIKKIKQYKYIILSALVLLGSTLYFLNVIDNRIELSENPEYLFSENFNPNNILVYGVGIGDEENKIDENLIEYEKNSYGWIHTINKVGYRILNEKVIEIVLSWDETKGIGLIEKDDIIIKFGEPDKLEGVINASDQDYYYIDRGIIARYHYDLGVNINILNNPKPYTGSELDDSDSSTDIDPDKIINVIKQLESGNPPILGETPTEEEIQNSPHIKQIRLALNGYLNGTNNGLEEGYLDTTNEEMECGLNNFDKTYYKSKFVVLDAYDNDYGGIQAYIVFIDKPDTVFWVWIYGIIGEQRLRTFCEKPITSDQEAEMITDIIKNSTYRL